jgi:Inverse autotransporter, beta-domain
VRTGRFIADYVLLFHLKSDSALFGEVHAEGWDFWKRSSEESSNRVDLSLGGGYRTMPDVNTLLGMNGFYDTSHLFNKWFSSGGIGLEMAANNPGYDNLVNLDCGSKKEKNLVVLDRSIG